MKQPGRHDDDMLALRCFSLSLSPVFLKSLAKSIGEICKSIYAGVWSIYSKKKIKIKKKKINIIALLF